MAATSWVASADPSSPFDLNESDVAAALSSAPALVADPSSQLDIAISWNGMTLIQEGTASAISGKDDLAIAIGDGANADAGLTSNGFYFTGQDDTAIAWGTNTLAYAGAGNFDTAMAVEPNPAATALTQAGAGGLSGSAGTDSSFDNASAFGNGVAALAGNNGGEPTGNLDSATVFDPFGTGGGGAEAENGVFDSANIFGDSDNALASQGDFNLADVFGNTSSAEAGAAGNFDLGAVFGDALNAHAIGGDFLTDILPAL